MNEVMAILAPILLLLVLATGWGMTLLSLPGNWLMVASVSVYAWLVPAEWRGDVSWGVVLVVLLLAIVGEVLETLAVAVGTARAGGSRRAALLGLCGSLGGGLAGALIGVPIPIVGPLVGAVLFAAVGAAFGAYVGESWKGRTANESWKVGQGAFVGRLLGTMAKILAASVILAVVLGAVVVK